MPTRDLIVIGGSAGSLDALKMLVSGLPPDLPAALCITRHITPHAPNVLPRILAKYATLPTLSAIDGAELRPGHIYQRIRATGSPHKKRHRLSLGR
jgi:two-component system, chemotaxis family, protein-glutamate methylesterase/glutaminase